MVEGRAREFSGVITVELTDGHVASRPLARDVVTSVGRGSVWVGLAKLDWVPRQFVILAPASEGWVARLGRGPVEVSGDFLSGSAQAGARILLHSGSWRLTWTALRLPLSVVVHVTPGPAIVRRGRAAHQDVVNLRVGTLMPGVKIRDDEARVLAVAFRPLLEGNAIPRGHFRTVAPVLGRTPAQLRNWLHKRRQAAQRQLAQDGNPKSFPTLEDYGMWLIHSGRITELDLPTQGEEREHLFPDSDDVSRPRP